MMPSGARPDPEDSGGGFRPSGRQVVGGIIAVVLIVFIAANNDDVPVNFVVTTVTLPLWLVLAGTSVLGVLVGMGLGARRTRRKYRRQS